MPPVSHAFQNGIRMVELGLSTDLAIAAPLANGSTSVTAGTAADRMGWYFDRSVGREKVSTVVMGEETLAVFPDHVAIGTTDDNHFLGLARYAFGQNARIQAGYGVDGIQDDTGLVLSVRDAGGTDIDAISIAPDGTTTFFNPPAFGGFSNNRILVSDGSGVATSAAALTDGQLLIGSTGLAPAAATLIAGTNVSIVNGAGTITINAVVGTGAPGGAITQVQYNAGGTFGGNAGLTFNDGAGVLSVGGAILNASGTVTDPSYAFTAAPDSGIYYDAGLRLTVSGALVATLTDTSASWLTVASFANNVGVAGSIYLPNATVGVPAYSFTSDTDTGLYLVAAGQLGFTVGGVLRTTLSTTSFSSTVPGFFPAATVSNTSIRLPHGTAPSAPVNGDIWTTTAGLFAQIDGATVGPIGAGSGGITGSGAAGYVTYWTSGSNISGEAAFTYNAASNTLTAGSIVHTGDGTVGAPSYSFTSDTDSGIYSAAPGTVGIATDGILRLSVNSTMMISTLPGIFPAASTTNTSIRLPHGVAPTGPTNGDMWTTTTGIFVRINGVTEQLNVSGAVTGTGTASQVTYWSGTSTVTGSANLTFDGTNFAHAGAGTFATGTGAVSLNGNTTIPSGSTLTVASDTDATTTLGRARIGSPTSDFAYFAHFDRMDSNQYALYQSAAGATRVNAITGQTIDFRIQDSTRASVSATAVTLASGINLALSGASTFTSGTGLNTFNGQVIVPDGSAASPGIRLTSEAHGLFRNSSMSLGFSVAGARVGYIQPDGLILGDGATGYSILVTGAAGTNRGLYLRSGTATNRWALVAGSATESGSDAGSPLLVRAYDDAGSLIDTVLTVSRAAGSAATWSRPNQFPAATTSIPSIRLPHGTAPSAPTNGDMWTTTSGVFARINGATVGPFGSGTVTGSGSSGQVTYWSGASAVTGSANFTYNGTSLLVVNAGLTGTYGGNSVQFDRPGNNSYIDQVGIGGTISIRTTVTTGPDTTSWTFANTLNYTALPLAIGTTSMVGSELLRVNGGSSPGVPGSTGLLIGAGQVRSGATFGFRAGSSSGGSILLEDTSVADGNRPFSYLSTVGGTTNIGNSNRSGDSTTSSIARITISDVGVVAVTSGSLSVSGTGPGITISRSGGSDPSITLSKVSVGSAVIRVTAADTMVFRNAAESITMFTIAPTALTAAADINLVMSGTAVITGGLGAVGTPAYSFNGDPDTGMYSPFANGLSFATQGVERLRIETSNILIPSASNTALYVPSTDRGIASGSTAGELALFGGLGPTAGNMGGSIRLYGPSHATIANGVSILNGTTETVRFTSGLTRGAVGGASGPAFSFLTDTNTGMYQAGADIIGFATNGVARATISTTAFTLSGISLIIPTSTPASAGAAGTAGTVTWDTDYVYVCVASNTWKRAAIVTWP